MLISRSPQAWPPYVHRRLGRGQIPDGGRSLLAGRITVEHQHDAVKAARHQVSLTARRRRSHERDYRWIPSLRILEPAVRHRQREQLMPP
jgi:hypothetical protein